ncbi:hypothetical protein ALMP_59200 [Streptomyces sp. A012304]|nr:hypothetical protein ALMP_59200 [Streptomyces sp. A012304]
MLDPFGIDMSAPISSHRAGPLAPASTGLSTRPTYSAGRRTPIHGAGTTVEHARQTPATRPELGLYMIQTMIAAPFCQVRSHWGCQVTPDTENNPLIGLPNQHIVGLTYVP